MLFNRAEGTPLADVVVLLPGIMGSRLERDGKQVWPGSVLDLIRHFSEDELLDYTCADKDWLTKPGEV